MRAQTRCNGATNDEWTEWQKVEDDDGTWNRHDSRRSPVTPTPRINDYLFIVKLPRKEGQPGMARTSPADDSDSAIRAQKSFSRPSQRKNENETRHEEEPRRSGKKRTNDGKEEKENERRDNRRVRGQRVGITHDKIRVAAKQERFFKHRTTKNTVSSTGTSLRDLQDSE